MSPHSKQAELMRLVSATCLASRCMLLQPGCVLCVWAGCACSAEVHKHCKSRCHEVSQCGVSLPSQGIHQRLQHAVQLAWQPACLHKRAVGHVVDGSGQIVEPQDGSGATPGLTDLLTVQAQVLPQVLTVRKQQSQTLPSLGLCTGSSGRYLHVACRQRHGGDALQLALLCCQPGTQGLLLQADSLP